MVVGVESTHCAVTERLKLFPAPKTGDPLSLVLVSGVAPFVAEIPHWVGGTTKLLVLVKRAEKEDPS